MTFSIFFIVIIITGNVFAQKPMTFVQIDSLNRVLVSATNNKDRVLALTALCHTYSTINFDSATIFGREAIRIADQNNFISEKVKALSFFGIALTRNGDIPQALQLQFDALKIAKENMLEADEAIALYSIGKSYQFLNDNPNAIRYAKQAKLLFQKIPHKPFKGYSGFYLWKNGSTSAYSDNELVIAVAYLHNNQKDSALVLLEQLAREATDPYWLNVTSIFLAEAYFKLGEQETGLKILRKVAIREEQNYLLSWVYSILSECFVELNQTDSVIHYAKLGLIEAQKVGFKDRILQSSKILAAAHENSDIVESHKYLKMATDINDELFGPEKVFSLQRTLALQQQQIRETEKAQIAYENKIKVYGLGLGLVIIFIIALILFRNNRHRRRAHSILQQQKTKIELTLSQLKSTQTQLIHSEKMASLGELTAGIAHEIQNPLNFVNNFSEVSGELVSELKEELGKEELEEVASISDDLIQNLEKINHHGQRASSIVKGMLEHSRTGDGTKELTDINKLADEYLRLSYHGIRAKDKSFNADFKTELDPNLPVINVVAQDIGRVLLNLINNAFFACTERSRSASTSLSTSKDYKPLVTVSTTSYKSPSGDLGVKITVKDNGLGIPDDIKDKIFEPFFTTKPTGQGTGLGLSMSYDIITKGHGGELEVESSLNKGSTFIISLPNQIYL